MSESASTRRSRRGKSKVNYSVYAGGEGQNNDSGSDFEVKSASSGDDDVEMVDGEVDAEVELENSDEEEFDEDNLPKKGKKLTAINSKSKSADNKKASSKIPVSAPVRPQRPKKSTDSTKNTRRNGTLIDRMSLVVGTNRDIVIEALRARMVWGNAIFIPPQADMGRFMPQPASLPGDVPFRQDQDISETDYESVSSYLIPKRKIILNGDEFDSFTDRIENQGMVLNAGGCVSSISWAPGFDDDHIQYLAVTLLDDDMRDPLDSQVNSPKISLYSKDTFNSSVYLYKLNLESSSDEQEVLSRCELISTFSHSFGSALDIRWRPGGSASSDSLGLLAMLNQDGKLRVIDVPKPRDHLTHYKITEPLRTFKIDTFKITAFCWRDQDNLTVGSDQGCLYEFSILESSTSTNSQASSYVISVAASTILTVASGYPNHPNLIYEFSSDGQSSYMDVRNPLMREYSVRMKSAFSVSAYLPWCSIFISSDDTFHTRGQPINDFRVQGTVNAFTTHVTPITALATSNYHPFVLSGSSDGQVKVANSIRRLMAPQRSLINSYHFANLWQLDFSANNMAYRIVDILTGEKIGKSDAVELLQPYPPNVIISDLEWSAGKSTAEWYAASTTSGIIRFHQLKE